MPHNAPQHGSISMYTGHACRCEACREAWRVYRRAYMHNPIVNRKFERRGEQWDREFIECRKCPGRRCQRSAYARDYRHECDTCLRAWKQDNPKQRDFQGVGIDGDLTAVPELSVKSPALDLGFDFTANFTSAMKHGEKVLREGTARSG